MKISFTFNYLLLLDKKISHQEDINLFIKMIDDVFNTSTLDEVMITFKQAQDRSLHPSIPLRWFQLIGLNHPKVNLELIAITDKMRQSIPLIKAARQAMNPFLLFSSNKAQTENTKLEQMQKLHHKLEQLCINEISKENIKPALKPQ
jgi:hypothetical protein